MIEKEIIQQLYNPNLTVYSVAFLFVYNMGVGSNNVNVKDIVLAYQLSSAISRFCLNLPYDYYKQIRIPDEFNLWGEKNTHLLKSRNVGYLFLLLTKIANEFNDGDTIESWMAETIDKAGLPSIDKIIGRVHQLMQEKKKELIDDSLKYRYRYLLEKGLENYEFNEIYKSFSLIEIVNGNLTIPPLLLGDDSIVPLPGKSLDNNIYDIEKSSEYSWDYNNFEDDFSQVCIS